MKNKISILLCGLALLLGIIFFFYKDFGFEQKVSWPGAPDVPKTDTGINQKEASEPTYKTNSSSSVPDHVITVLKYIQKFQKPPDQYVGGRIFQNRENKLKRYDDKGYKIIYKEWDVHPKIKGVNRGAERLITGSDQSAYYTKDHYNSFIQIRL